MEGKLYPLLHDEPPVSMRFQHAATLRGIMSRYWPSDRHALFVDVDSGIGVYDLCRMARAAIETWCLPPIHIWESSPGRYHLIALGRYTIEDVELYQEILHGDPRHIARGREVGYWILRAQDWPGHERHYLGALPSPHEPTATWRDLYECWYGPVSKAVS